MNIPNSLYHRRHFPSEVIAYAVFAYHRFALRLRDVEDLLAERGVTVSYETIRVWCAHFGPKFASRLRKRQSSGGDHWYLDEMHFVTVRGERQVLWRAVDQDGDTFNILVQKRKDKQAALRFFRKLLKGEGARTKTRRARRVPLNSVAQRVIEDCRREHDEQVFVYRGSPVTKINNTAWKKARSRAGLTLRVHDLRHCFAVRLREAGVHAWTISALLGHQSRTMTEHYAQPRMAELLEAVKRLCLRPERAPGTVLELRVSGAKYDITQQS